MCDITPSYRSVRPKQVVKTFTLIFLMRKKMNHWNPCKKIHWKNSKTPKESLKGINIPLCGDLLGCERVSGAKKLRSGCDYRTERFDHIVENVAQWHTKQSFLGVCCPLDAYSGTRSTVVGGGGGEGGRGLYPTQ